MDFTTKLAEVQVETAAGEQGAVTVEPRSLYATLRGVGDSRGRRGRRYEAAAVLTIIVLSKLAGERTLSGIAEWARLRRQLLCATFGLRSLPCANTYRYVCDHVELAELNAALRGYFRAARGGVPSPAPSPAPAFEHLACDGKELRGTYRRPQAGSRQPAAAMQGALGIYSVTAAHLEALLPIGGKGREAAALVDYLRGRSCENVIITADALHTQRRLCRLIRRQQGDYLFVVKRNQRSLYEDIRFLFSAPPQVWFPEQSAQTSDHGHGRIEVRRIRTTTALNRYLADRWPGVAQVFLVERQVTQHGKTVHSFVGGLTSLAPHQASPRRLLQLLREHWHIENRNHWRRDASLGEDACKVASPRAALTLALLNNAVLFLLDRTGHRNARTAIRTFNASPERALLLLCRNP